MGWAIIVALVLGLWWVAVPSVAASRCRATSRDSDRDRMPDCWERRNGLTVGIRDGSTDRDDDGLTALREYRLDKAEGGIFGPYRADDPNSDNDGGGDDKDGWSPPTLDGWEDLDGDGFGNLAEYVWGTAPASAASVPDLPAVGCVPAPSGLRDDASRDVSHELQAVLDAVPDGGCAELPAGARYRVNGTIKLVWRNDFTVLGNGAKLIATRPGWVGADDANSLRPHVQVIGGRNITLDGIVVDGPNGGLQFRERYEAEHAFDVKGATNLTIRNSGARQVYGDFVYVDDIRWPPSIGDHFPTTGLRVTGNTLRGSGRHGFAFGADAIDVLIEGNDVSRVHRSAVNFEMIPGRVVSDVRIVGNTFRTFGLNWIAAGDGIARDIYLGGNEIIGDSMHVKVGPRTPGLFHERWVFEGNVSNTEHRGDRAVFFMFRMHEVTFIRNVQPMYPDGGGRVFEFGIDVCGVTLVDNLFANYKELFSPAEPTPC